MNTVTTVRKGATQDEDRECPVKTSPCLSKCNSYLWMPGFQGKTTAPPHTHTHIPTESWGELDHFLKRAACVLSRLL